MHRLVPVTLVLLLACGCGGGTREIGRSADSPAPPVRADERPAVDVAYVLASRAGVELVAADGERTSVSDDPAAVAFGLPGDLVILQHAGGPGEVYPPRASGPIELWSGGQQSELPTDPDAALSLLDAGIVDGRSVAVVAEEFRDRPDDPQRQVTLIDLEGGARTTVVPRQPAWESSYVAARLLSDGDLVALQQIGVATRLVLWTASAREPAWTVEVATDRTVGLAALGGSIFVVEPSFDRSRGFAPELTVTSYDARTGEQAGEDVIGVRDPSGSIDTGLFCGEWFGPTELSCAHSGGAPVLVSLDDGSFVELPGQPGAIPTRVRGG